MRIIKDRSAYARTEVSDKVLNKMALSNCVSLLG